MPKKQSTENVSSGGRGTDKKLDASTAFENVDIDYSCPLTVKKKKIFTELFTCLTVRDARIEMVSKLDTDSFLKVMRFIARRCKPVKLISDNETIFVGADREFKELQQGTEVHKY